MPMLVFPYRDHHVALNPAHVTHVERGPDSHAIVHLVGDSPHPLHLQERFAAVVQALDAALAPPAQPAALDARVLERDAEITRLRATMQAVYADGAHRPGNTAAAVVEPLWQALQRGSPAAATPS